MNRFLAIVAATAASAAVAAAITLPAGADPSSNSDTQFVSCLRAHGADIPADTQGVAIKQWLGAHENDDAVMQAMKTCNANSPAPEELVSCLRAHGLDVPSLNDQLKSWIAQHANDPDAKRAFEACHFGGPDAGGPRQDAKSFADCLRHNGADVPANLDGIELKSWVRDHASSDAVKACAGPVGRDVNPGCGPGKPATPAVGAEPATVRVVPSGSRDAAAQ